MIDIDFCQFLEYWLCRAFEYSEQDEARRFWCDGVVPSQAEKHYSRKFVNDNRQVILKAFIGETGQTEYELTLKFGKKALSRYARGLEIIQCVPTPNEKHWMCIEVETLQLEIQLY